MARLAALLVLVPAPLLADEPLQIEAEPSWESEGPHRVGGVAFGDGNGDGLLDVAIGNYTGGSTPAPRTTQIFFGTGSALAATPGWSSKDEMHTTSVGWALLGGEVQPTLISVNGGSKAYPTVMYAADTTPGVIGTMPVWVSNSPVTASGIDYALGDVNGDGAPDLFVAHQCSGAVSCSPVPTIGFQSGSGPLPQTPTWVSDELNQYAGIALGDLDRSSVEERWHEATGDDHRRVFWLPGAPIQRVLRVLVDGGDPGPLTVNVKSGYVALARPPSADATVEIHYEVGSEGDLLVATRPASGQPGGIFVYSNSGGELPAKRTRTIGDATNRYKSLALVDMDLDGDLDLVAAGAGPAPVALYTNDEGALRTSPGWIPADTDQKAEDLAVGDFNADGYPDVCVVQFAGGPAVRIYRNDRGVLEPTPSVAIPYIGAAIGSVGSGDVNGDGVTDLFLGLAGAPARAYVSQSPPADPPVVNRVSAAGFEPGRGGSITIEGAGFVLPVRVYLGERMLDNVTLASSTSIAADLPADLAEDRYDVVVVNPDLRSGIAAGAVTIGAHPKSDNQEDGGSSDASGCRSAGGDGASSFAPFPALALALWLARRRSCKRSG